MAVKGLGFTAVDGGQLVEAVKLGREMTKFGQFTAKSELYSVDGKTGRRQHVSRQETVACVWVVAVAMEK